MKKLFILVALLSILGIAQIWAQQEVRVAGEMWNRYTFESGTTRGDTLNTSIRKNFFSLERGYFRLQSKFTDNISGRFTVDMFSSGANEYRDGAGLKLKDAYLDFNNLIPVPDMKLTVGLHKVWFGTLYDWDYTLIGKAPADEYGFCSSSDYGISVSGHLPGGLGEYNAGLYNGEGYKVSAARLKDNITPEFNANIRLTPIPGLSLGGSVLTNSLERENLLLTNAPNPAYNTQLLVSGLGRVAMGPLDLWAEYFSKSVEFPNVAKGSKDYTANGIMIMPIVNLKSLIGSDIQLVGRYDRWDETDNPSNKNLSNTVTAGVNYNFLHNASAVPAMQLQLNYSNRTYDATESAAAYQNGLRDYDLLMLQLKWRFQNTIK